MTGLTLPASIRRASCFAILSKKKRISVPSEMEDIVIKPEMLSGASGEVTVMIEEGSV